MNFILLQFSSVAQLCPTLCDHMDLCTPGFLVHHQLPEFTQTHIHESVMPSNHLILCHPLLLPSILPASGSFPSSQFFASGSQMSFNFIISLFNEYSGLISFRMDWLYLLVILLSNTITPINSLKGIRT